MAQSDRSTENGDLAARAARWAFDLVAVPSVTGTPDEAAFAPWLRARLAALPCFTAAPESVWTVPVPGDPLGRASVAALVRGSGARTVVLSGHFDTVHIADYGDLAPLARHPQALRQALLASLAGDGLTAAEARARADLESGAFLPGRGLLDMKSGLAAGLAVLENFAARPERPGNLLFLAVPDEEANSAGARSAAQALPDMARRLGLSLDAAINLDSLVDDGDGEAGRAIALGTIGKLLPSALVVGRAVHASDTLAGLNAGVIAAEIVGAMEWAPALVERTGDETAPPPTLLGLKDNRLAYDVTTPERIWAYWNVMTHGRDPADVLARFGAICGDAAARALGRLRERSAVIGGDAAIPAAAAILTFRDLHAEVVAGDRGAEERISGLAHELAARRLDIPEQCRILTEHLWAASRRAGPAVVIGFASLPYLPTALAGDAGERLARAARRSAAEIAAEHGASIAIRRYFRGISDMSFFGQTDTASLAAVAANTPAWRTAITEPAGPEAAGVPMINAGPWGRDFHTRLERLHTGYAFDVLPNLLRRLVELILRPE